MKSKDEYEQAAEDVIQYIEARLDGGREKQRLTIQDKEDLRSAFKNYGWSDERGGQRKLQNGDRLNNFIDIAIETRAADQVIRRGVLGHFGQKQAPENAGRASVSKGAPSYADARAKYYHEKGSEVYPYKGGYVYKTVKVVRGRPVVRFRDVRTEKYVKSSEVKNA